MYNHWSRWRGLLSTRSFKSSPPALSELQTQFSDSGKFGLLSVALSHLLPFCFPPPHLLPLHAQGTAIERRACRFQCLQAPLPSRSSCQAAEIRWGGVPQHRHVGLNEILRHASISLLFCVAHVTKSLPALPFQCRWFSFHCCNLLKMPASPKRV